MIWLISMTICAVIGLSGAKPVGYYATRYDHIDVDTILNNRRMVNYYASCLLNKGPCPPQGIEFKRILPEALETNCKYCTEKQKTIALRTIKRIRKEYPKVWEQLKEVWDPDDIFVRKFEATFSKKSTQPKPQIFNRFGDDSTESNEIITTGEDKNGAASRPVTERTDAPTLFTSSSSTSTTLDIKFTTTTTKPTTTTTTSKITTTTTRKPSTSSIRTTFKPRTWTPPFRTSTASLDPAVSFGGKVVGNLVRGFESVTKKVAETGVNLAGAVFSSISHIARPLVLL